MFDDSFRIESPTGALLNTYRADARGHERGVLLVFHGLAEHAARHARLAAEMAERGFHVYAHDHRGHGSTTAADAPLRRFAKKTGMAKVLVDCRSVLDRARKEHPNMPVVLLGQSMGAHIAMNFALTQSRTLAGLALWNAAFGYGAKEKLGVAMLKAERALKGSDVASDIFARATFEAWGRAIEPRRTMGDWLSHDEAAVERYLADPLCGWTPTVSMALDVLGFVEAGSGQTAWSGLAPGLPIHVLAGSEDPATRLGEAAHALAGGLRHAGSRDVTLLVVEGARHEASNEIEPVRSLAIARFAAWLDRIVPSH